MHRRSLRIVLGTAALSVMTIVAVKYSSSLNRDPMEKTARFADQRRHHRAEPSGRLSDILGERDAARRNPLWQDWFRTDPAAAGAALLRMSANEPGNPEHWHDLMSQLAARWITTEPKAALAWVKSLPDGPGRVKAEVQCAYHWTEADPQAAAAYALTRENPALHEAVIGKWAELDSTSATTWAMELQRRRPASEGPARAAAIWAQSDPQAASAFAATLEDPHLRRRLQASIATSWAMIDPARSFEWAETIADTDSRETTTERAAEAWIQSDPPAARRRIETSSLPEPVKKRLLAMADP